jgi:spore maturation protein SpmB
MCNQFQVVSVFTFIREEFFSFWFMPLLMLLIVSYGTSKGVKIYEAVTEGAKQGFDIAIRIIPYLVTIYVAIGMFRASGAMDILIYGLSPITVIIGMPPETLPMAILRPLSGSGAFAFMSSLVTDAPDSKAAFVASTMMGSTETTFYVLAIYFGAVGIVRIRHALVAALCADITGIIVSSLAGSWFWRAVCLIYVFNVNYSGYWQVATEPGY